MDTAEEKETAKVETRQIDSLYFVVRELDAIHKRIDDAVDSVHKRIDRVEERLSKVEESINELRSELKSDIQRSETSLKEDIKELRSFMIKLTFSVAGLIIAGVAILFSIMKH